MANNYNNSQIHYGIGDIVGKDKVISNNEKKWYEKPIGIIILMVLGGIILGGILYSLGWN